MRLSGKRVVVSGAAGGIGSAVCALFEAEGARVAALDLRDPSHGSMRLACDLADDTAVAAAASTIEAAFGGADAIVHGVTAGLTGATLDTSPATMLRLIDVDVGGALRLLQAFAPGMKAQNSGSIVFISSINARFATPGLAAYAASKAALDAVMRTAAVELAPHGVRVNAIQPASIDTPLLRRGFDAADDPAAARAANVARHPLGRLGTADDVAGLALFLCSDESAWITGASVPLDGGAGVTRR